MTSFDPILFLYLQPELQVEHSLDTVEKAHAFYQNNTSLAEEQGWIWNLDFLPPRFNARLFLAQVKNDIASSEINATIKEALEVEQGVDLSHLLANAQYVPTLYFDAKVFSQDAFIIQEKDEFEYLHGGNLNSGDQIQVLLKNDIGFVKTLYVTVKERIDAKTFSIQESHIIKSAYVGAKCLIYGIKAFNIDRLASIAYLRLEKRLGKPPTSLEHVDTTFNADLFRLLYPTKRNLDDATAYLEYVKQNMYEIGSAKDIGSLKKVCPSNPPPQNVFDYDTYVHQLFTPAITFEQIPESNGIAVPSNIDTDYYNLNIHNSLVLDFESTTGYIRFNGQDVYYITTNHTRTAEETDPFFQGLITERAIKHYVDRKYLEEARFNDVQVSGETSFKGDTLFGGSSNLFSNIYAAAGHFENIRMHDSVLSNVEVHDSEFQNITLSNSRIADVVLSNVKFNQTTFSGHDITFDATILFTSNATFYNHVDLYGRVNTHDVLLCKSNVVFESLFEAHNASLFHSNVSFHGDVEHTGSIVLLGGEAVRVLNNENERSVHVAGNDLYIHCPSSFSNVVTFTDEVTFREKSVFQEDTYFEKNGVFNGDVFISGRTHFTTTNLSNMDLEELRVRSTLNVHGPASFQEHVEFLSNVSFSNRVVFDAPLTSLQPTKLHHLEVMDAFHVFPEATFTQDVYLAQDLHVDKDLTVKKRTILNGPLESLDTTTFHQPTHHKDGAFFSNDVHFLSNMIFYEDMYLLSNDLHVRNVLSTHDDQVVAKGLRVTEDAVLEAGVHLVGTGLQTDVPSVFTRPIQLSNTSLSLENGSVLSTDAGSVTDHYGRVHFRDTTHFEDDIFLDENAAVQGHFRCLSNLYVGGIVHTNRLQQHTNSNDPIVVASPMTWKEESTFEDKVIFSDRALFTQPVDFESNVKFRGKVKFREPLSSLEVADLAVSQRLFLDDVMYGSKDATIRGHMTWCNANTFTVNSPLQGYIKFINNETHHHGPFTFYDDVNVCADTHFSGGCNVVFSDGFISQDDAHFQTNIHVSCNLHFTHAHPRVFGALTFWDEIVMQDTLTLDSNIVMNGDVLFNSPITFGVHVHVQDSITMASDAQSVFSNAPIFRKSPDFRDGVRISNEMHLISQEEVFSVKGEAHFQDKIVFQDELDASRGSIDRLHVHDQADFDPHVTFSNTVAFLGATDFLHDINFSQQTIYGNPRFAEKVYFNDDVRAKKNVLIDSKLAVIGQTTLHKTLFEDNAEFKDMRLTFSSNTTLEGMMQIEAVVHTFCNLHVHAPAQFNERVRFHSGVGFSNVATFGERAVFRDDIILTDKNHIHGEALFESNIRFASGIAVAESLNAEGHILTQHMTLSNGQLDIEKESTLYLHENSDFIMEHGGKARFLNQETTFASPVHFENVVSHSNDVFFLQDVTFKSNVSFLADVNGGGMKMSNVHIQDLLTSCYCKVDGIHADNASIVSTVGSNLNASNLYITDTAELHKAFIETGIIDACTASQVEASNIQSKKMATELAEIVDLLVQNDSTFANIRVTDKIRTQNIGTCNISTYELESVFIDSSNIACQNGSFVDVHANRSSNDHLYAANAHLVHADAEQLRANTLNVQEGRLSNLNADDASLSNLFSLNATFDSLSAKGRSTLNDVFTDRIQSRHTSFCNLAAADTILENLEVKNVKIHQNFEQNTNTIAKFNNVSVVNAYNDNLNVVNMARMNGETFFNNSSFFKSNTYFDAPVELDGGMTVRGSGDKVNTLHNTELTTATLDGNVQFKSSPVMKNNLVIEGALMGPRIGIGPYNKAFRLGTNIDMKNVIYLNSKTNTKVFGNKAAPQIGLNGGEGTLEILFYHNAIVNLGQGMQTFDLYFSPQNILDEMIGRTGSITFIEKSILGRNITFDGVCVFASSDDNENGTDSRVVKTTTASPDIYGGYALDILTYTVLSKESILCDYKNISTVSGDRPGIKQELWLYTIDNSGLYVHSIVRDDDSALKIMCSRNTSDFIEFSEDFYSNSSRETTFVLHMNNKGQCTDVIRTLYRQSIPDRAFPLNTTLRNDGKNMVWCVKMIHNDDEEIISFDILDNQLKELTMLSSESAYKKQSMFALVFQDSAERVTWTRVVKNLDIVDHLVTGQKTTLLGNGSATSNEITVHDNTGFKHNELDYKKAYVLHFDQNGVLKWFVSLSEKTVCLARDQESNTFIGYVRVPENPSSLVDGKGKKKEHTRYFQYDEGFSNVTLAKLDKEGSFQWFTQMISRGQHTLLAMEVLISADVVVCFHNDNIDPVYSYNGFDVYDKEVVPKDIGKDQVNLQSWESYLVVAKYNTTGITQWFSLISNVDTRLSNINKIISPSTRGGFLVAFRPETKKHSVYQTTVFDAEKMVAFSMNAEDTAGKNLIFVVRYSNKGKVIWRVELDQGDDESLLDDLAITEIVDGGVCLASGKWSSDTSQSQLTDADGNTRRYEKFAVIKLSSRGIVIDDES